MYGQIVPRGTVLRHAALWLKLPDNPRGMNKLPGANSNWRAILEQNSPQTPRSPYK
jgi:hypothetical protein